LLPAKPLESVVLLVFAPLIKAALLRSLQKLDNSTLFLAGDIGANTHLMNDRT
jgi:hypothetical protein